MGLFDSIFGGKERRQREMDELMNPLLGWRLQHFVAILEDPVYLKHYFQFKNKEGGSEEFIVVYRRFDPEFHYLRTHHRNEAEDFYVTLSERGPWSIPITFLIELGKQLPANTQSPNGHHAAQISAGTLRYPVWPKN
jgi:hypothetical protein